MWNFVELGVMGRAVGWKTAAGHACVCDAGFLVDGWNGRKSGKDVCNVRRPFSDVSSIY